jgi:5-methylcytosine-specific restriction enzyme subunit McrC
MLDLFEYQNSTEFNDDHDELEIFLDDIWNRREVTSYYGKGDGGQQFLQFIRKSKEIKSKKYVGVIHFNDTRINLFPKIFYRKNVTLNDDDRLSMQKRILWWLSYCRRIKFPFSKTTLDREQGDFFEVLIYMFAKCTRELLANVIYQQYQEIDRELNFVKGRILIGDYLKNNLSNGQWHKVSCEFDSFEIDNQFNRAVKHVCEMLSGVSKSTSNKNMLREILFILDDVRSEPCSAETCAAIQFNPMFSDFETVRDYCVLFLKNSVSFSYKNSLKLFAFLLPMEYVFEDFVLGFIDREVDGLKASGQVSTHSLATDGSYQLRPDLILENCFGKKIIADTKYKIIYRNKEDVLGDISQGDLYQMAAYAIRFKIKTIFLYYPDTATCFGNLPRTIIIRDEFGDEVDIQITIVELPVLRGDIGAIASAISSSTS